ncbi:signal peptidase I [Actinokineospora globicatena]|uniref:Signal peptidase I n=1 Tax=Actinokineospora globicatena TaxID=103729 RepID=A0A9W6QRK0_9PSEU|nr:signal peptidase I [Actinokineospora globicatena]MCP2305837.1 signal peptidase I [Actinokineospora globicatena]GLW80298.1 hypothetical protein Aglo01_47790 [Actinokineospora globicatena]GLW87126.1 hypothetical protein Aglo02_47650 [Actinokineospora globicatena]GLW93490.1 hypothetical protein Aglo03_43060 [Actinokineospora globicatena]
MTDQQRRRERRGAKHRAAPSRAVVRLLAAVGAVLVLGLVLVLSWRATGGRWLSVDSPSMGQAAPVGTLVLTRPTTLDEVRVGDIISFDPVEGGVTHTHRVSRITDGVVFTKGDINGAEDPRPVAADHLVGKVVARLWGVAYLVKSLPVLLPGAGLVWLLTRWSTPRWRMSTRLVGYSVVVCAAILVLRPLVNAAVLTTIGEAGLTTATVVATGLLPIRVQDPDGVFADLHAGQVGELVSAAANADGQVPFTVDAHMSVLWWTVCLALCCVPLAVSVVLGRRTER